MSDAVTVRVDDDIAWITLNRPDALNAIDDAMRAALPAAIESAEADPSVRCLVVRGAGDRAFCVGADIKEFARVDEPARYRQARAHAHWIAAFDRARKPIVAAIHGYCLGGGLEIALACDIRLCASDAQFGFPETGHGIIPAAGGTQRITRVIGLGVALDLVLTGERIDARRALSIGLVSRLAEEGGLDALARVVAGRIARQPPLATMFAKEAVRLGMDHELGAGMRMEVDLFTHLVNCSDRIEAAAAFREKRPPRFDGR